ncbi:MAG: DUF423 domain-containing protein [Candidatus Marinimicrobia bacterium]|nr:DUF423 domain-containing protein [Candidatus Neomarinimicrobiota bacterium]MDP6789695.1 DUF423 domain-containing protein [Candidatus Neomarinimicrobiota bacterium]MDP7071602.1 DUF423 domain-containing protein [Candidatus Neomarinimicrobiota bacterium]
MAGTLLAALSVIFGAFGSHGLKTRVAPEMLAVFETGVRYHFYHALGLIMIGILGFHYSAFQLQLPAMMMSTGILVFSGTLYLLVLTGQKWLGAVTPIGGLLLILSWATLAYRIYRTG